MRRLALALVIGCAPAPGVETVTWLDRETFASDIEPIFERQCADPTCHGRPERALSIYAPLRWRRDASRTHIPEPLTPAEMDHNFVAACLLGGLPSRDASSLLARKPLANGGLYHGGGASWDGTTDPSYRAIVAWIADAR